jgi:hypothetical protein
MGHWSELKEAWGKFSRVASVEIQHRAKQASKSVAQAGKNAATSVWDNREAIAKAIVVAVAHMAEGIRAKDEAAQQQAQRQAEHQPHSDQGAPTYLGPDDYDEPTVVADWEKLPNGLASDLSGYRKKVGHYRMTKQSGDVVYVGRATEHKKGGLKKRLTDYTRRSDSGRKHKSGQQIYENRENLTVEVFVMGEGVEAARVAKQFEPGAIRDDNPLWNKHHRKTKE